MPLSSNVGGTWSTTTVSVNIGGAWNTAVGAWVNVGGTWQPFVLSATVTAALVSSQLYGTKPNTWTEYTYNLSCSVSAGTPSAYQWYANGSAIAGATNSYINGALFSSQSPSTVYCVVTVGGAQYQSNTWTSP